MRVIAVPAAGSQMWSVTQTQAHMASLTSSRHMLNVIEQWSWTLVKTRRKGKKGGNWEKEGGECGGGSFITSQLPPLNGTPALKRLTRGCSCVCKRWKRLQTSIKVYAAEIDVQTSRRVYVHVWEGERLCVCARVMDCGRLKHSPDGKVCVRCGAEWERRKRPNASQLGNTSMRSTGTPSRHHAAPTSSQASDGSKQRSSRNVPD